MRRTEPHSGLCHQCGQPVILAHLTGQIGVVLLDPEPDPHGPYRAHNGISGVWIASRINPTAPAHAESFKGMRRHEHICPDEQLELGSE